MGIADRFLYLRDGRIAAEYTPEDFLLLPEADILGMGLRSPHEGKSVAEELLLNTELTEENKDRARHLLKEFGLYEYRDAHPSTLSGGQKQRLAIACAIFSGRRILILDEPTSGLDGQNMRLIAERMKSEARNGRTILVITHDRELIESCCDNVAEVGTKPSEVQ